MTGSSPTIKTLELSLDGSTVEVFVVWRKIVDAMDTSLWDSLNEDERRRFEKISNEDRKREWCEGRRALRSLPDGMLFSSVSHSEQMAVAVGTRARIRGLGVDLEPRDRILSPRLVEWLGHDDRWTPNALETWTVKEACFKCDKEQNEGLVLANYEIVSSDEAIRSSRRFYYRVIRESGWIFALAVC